MVRTLVARLAGALVLATAAAAATAAALATPAPAATPRRAPPGRLQIVSGPPGSQLTLTAIADSGNAVGNIKLASGRREGVFWNGKGLVGARDTLGAGSALTAINDRDDIAGWTSTNATASVTDLLSGTGPPSAMPHALFLPRSGSVRVLPDPSFATAVNLAEVVVGVFRAGDGKLHAFAWNNGPPPGRAKLSAVAAPPAFVDLGVGAADGEDDFGDIVGQLNGVAGWWTLGANGQYTFVSAGFAGELMAINIHRHAFGSQADQMTGGSSPVAVWGVGQPVTRLALNPFEQGADFFAGGLSDGPVIAAGELGPKGDQQPLLGFLAAGRRFLGFADPELLLAPALRRRYRILTLGGASIGGMIAGSAAAAGDGTAAILLMPTVVDMLDHAGIDLLEAQGVYRDLQLARIDGALRLTRGGHINRACRGLTRVRRRFGADAGSAATDDAYGFYDHLYWTIWEAQADLRCPGLPPLAYRPFAGRPPLRVTP